MGKVSIGPDGRPAKIPEFPVLGQSKEEQEAIQPFIDGLRRIGMSDDEIDAELRAQLGQQGEPQDPIRRVPPPAGMQMPLAPLSQQTMDRLHEPAHPEIEDRVMWPVSGEAARHRQFIQTDAAGIMQTEKDDLVLALIGGKGGGFSAAETLSYVFYSKNTLMQKSRLDLGGVPERLATVAQLNLSKQSFEEIPERPKESRGFIQRFLGR